MNGVGGVCPVSLLRPRKRETKTRRFASRSAGKAASQSNTTRRAPQLILLIAGMYHTTFGQCGMDDRTFSRTPFFGVPLAHHDHVNRMPSGRSSRLSRICSAWRSRPLSQSPGNPNRCPGSCPHGQLSRTGSPRIGRGASNRRPASAITASGITVPSYMTRFYGASLPPARSSEHAPGFADRADLLGVEARVQAQVDRQLHGALGVFDRAVQQLDLGIVSHALFDRGASRSTSAMPPLGDFVIVSSCSLIWALRGRSDSHPRLTLITNRSIRPSVRR